jgi:hypothetical protein
VPDGVRYTMLRMVEIMEYGFCLFPVRGHEDAGGCGVLNSVAGGAGGTR